MKETTLFGLRVACYSLIAFCLVCEGAIVGFTGFPFAGLPWCLYVVGFLWALTSFAAVYEAIRPRPILVFLAGCALFAGSAVVWFHYSEEKSWDWFLYSHSLELGVIVASLVLYLISRKQRRGKTEHAV
jgi:hypothetical protein